MKSSASLLLFQRLTIAQPALCTLGRSMEMNLAVPANHFRGPQVCQLFSCYVSPSINKVLTYLLTYISVIKKVKRLFKTWVGQRHPNRWKDWPWNNPEIWTIRGRISLHGKHKISAAGKHWYRYDSTMFLYIPKVTPQTKRFFFQIILYDFLKISLDFLWEFLNWLESFNFLSKIPHVAISFSQHSGNFVG